MSIKLIALDLDGTTLNDDRVISEANRKALEEAIDRGVNVVIATGRTYSALPEDVFRIRGIQYVLTSNGAIITDLREKKVIYENCIAPPAVEEAVALLKQYDFMVEAFTEGHAYIDKSFYDHIKQTGLSFRHVDYVLTTREICRLIKADHINVPILPEREFDSLLGASTGAGAIFGTSGGVTEAALRSAYYILTGEKPDISPQAPLGAVREAGLIKELEFDIKGMTVRCAVVNSLGAARRLIRSIRRGEAAYDFVEIMACPGGCVGGGGQPIRPSFTENPDDTSSRSACLYYLDKTNKIRFSHENPEIQALYREYLEKPSSEKAHELLHVVHTRWEMPGPPAER